MEVTRHARRAKTDVMPFRWPSEQEPFALFHLSVSTAASFSNYYDSVDVLTPFLRDRAWIEACAGYYLNSVDRGVPRLTYFASDAGAATSVINGICSRTALVHVKPPSVPRADTFTKTYGGSEARFRRYLCTYTQIALDLLAADRLHAQRLFATYRWRAWIAGTSAKAHLERSFVHLSPCYETLSEKERRDFWVDLEFLGWSHMFVNMILAIDWDVPRNQAAVPPSDAELTRFLARQGLQFDIPTGWNPD